MRLVTKTSIMIVVLISGLGISMGYYFIRHEAYEAEKEMERRAMFLLKYLEHGVEPALRNGDSEGLSVLAGEVLKEDDVAFVTIKTKSGKTLVKAGDPQATTRNYSVPVTPSFSKGGRGGMESSAEGTGAAGNVTIGISLDDLKKRGMETRRATVIIAATGITMSVAVGFAIVVFFVNRRLNPLLEGLNRFGRGDFSYRVRLKGKDEFAGLAQTFNRMAEEISWTVVSKEYVDNIIKSMRDALFVVDREGNVRTVNESALFLVQCAEKDLVGMPFSILLADPDKYEEWMGRLERDGFVGNVETNLRASDGWVFPVMISCASMNTDDEPDATVYVVRDITERKIAEEKLKRSLEFNTTVLNSLNDSVVIVEVQSMKIISANEVFLREYDVSPEEIVGKTCYEITHQRNTPCEGEYDACPLSKTLETGEHATAEHVHFGGRGEKIFVEVTTSPIRNEEGTIIQVVHASKDITIRKQAQEAMSHLAHKLIQYSNELEKANDELRNFAYIVSHDLRAPLVNIRGFASELEYTVNDLKELLGKYESAFSEEDLRTVREVVDRDIHESLEYIATSVDRMDGQIKAILNLSRIGRRDLVPEEVAVDEVVRGILSSLGHQIEKKKVAVVVGELPAVVADRTSIEQIMGNLIDNALKYMESEREGELEVGGEERGEYVIYRVRDNGRGIAKEDIGKVFDIFRRVGKQDVEGEGMGLAYVKTMVRRLGGRIWCKSEVGEGTEFGFSVPKEVLEEEMAEEGKELKQG